jgi:phosphatidylinositol alpha-mannosyltransferase
VKIALVSPYDWSYPGGVQDHIRRLAAALRSRDHSVRILTPATGPRARHVEYGVFKLAWAAPLRMNGSVARVSITPDVNGRIRNVLEVERFDIVHLHEPFASALTFDVLRLAPMSGALYLGTFHAWARRGLTSTPDWAYASAKPFLSRYMRRLHGRIAVSPAAREFVSRFFPGDYRIIPNGVDIHRFQPAVAPLPRYRDGKRNIVFLGRLEPRKGLKFLLRALPRIRERFPNTRFLIGGDGAHRTRIEAWVQKQGWRDIVFLGRVAAEDLPSLYISADVFCAPSVGGESQGIVLLEAMAAGRAVVASDIPGYRSVIHDGVDGLLARPRDAEHLAWAICHLLGDAATRRRMGAAARLRAEGFGWERVSLQVESYYDELWARYVSPTRHIAPPSRAVARAT